MAILMTIMMNLVLTKVTVITMVLKIVIMMATIVMEVTMLGKSGGSLARKYLEENDAQKFAWVNSQN